MSGVVPCGMLEERPSCSMICPGEKRFGLAGRGWRTLEKVAS